MVQNALNRNMRFSDLHSDSGDLREFLQCGSCDGVSHRFQKIMWRTFNDVLTYPAEIEAIWEINHYSGLEQHDSR
jgi:hypothetical protein